MKDKVTIIFRRTSSTKYSVASLVAALDTKLLNRTVDIVIADSFNEIIDVLSISNHSMIIIAYSLLTTQLPSLMEELQALSRIKGLKKNIITIAGGPHSSGDPIGTINLGFDCVFINEAEESLPLFIDTLIEGGDPLATVRGIITRSEEDVYYYSGRPRPVNLDDFPPFAYWRGLYSPIEITRGCPYACKYCQVSIMHGAKPRHRSLQTVLKYSKILLKSGRKDLRFITPNAFSYLGDGINVNIDGLCNLIEGLWKITREYKGRIFLGTFPSEVRPEHAAIDDAVKCIVGKVSNKRIIIGAQSGSERILRTINRGHGVDDIIEAVYVLNKHGFDVDVDFILGMPPEDEEDMEKSIELMEYLTSRFRVRIHAHYYLPLPGSPFDIARPKPIPNRLRRRLFKLLGKGKLYGDWLKQEELSRSIVSLWEKGIIVGIKGFKKVKITRNSFPLMHNTN